MNTRKFLETVWPPSGPYCIATPWVKPDGEKCYVHRGCDTIDDAMGYILAKKQSKDLYFAPHALKVIRELNPKTGKLQTFRTHANMREAQDFFFDIDAGGPKDRYATQDEVLSALEQFLFETGLPSPFVINSGYGIHVHWIIDTPIESVAWKEPAARLRWLAQEHSLHIDPSKVVDQSSVLRVPGTFNYKDPATPRKVVILAEGVVTPTAEFVDRLNQLTSAYTPMAHKPSPHAPGSKNYSVAWDGRRPTADEVAAVCEHMRTFRDSQGNVSEPQWHVGVGTLKYCDEGEIAAHKWSSGYPKYTQAETQKKLDDWTTPPPGCDKISQNSGDPAICARCPHLNAAKNPVLIANKVYEDTHPPAQVSHFVTLELPCELPCNPPSGFALDPKYGITLKGEGVICNYLMFPVELVEATRNEEGLSRWQVKYPRKGWKKIEIPNSALDARNLTSTLCNKGIILIPGQGKLVHWYMRAYLKELQKCQDDLSQYDYMGWEFTPAAATELREPKNIGTPENFIIYGKKISAVTGKSTPCIMTRNTQLDGMGKAGTLNQQIALMHFYKEREYMAQQFAICASLATPFFRYTGEHGMLICLTGDTGASKSTGIYTAASLWGHPKLYPLSGLDSTSTFKGRQEWGAAFRNLPFIIDEITRFENAIANEMALAASQPGVFISLKNNREFRYSRGGCKSNLTLCTSNESLVHKVNADRQSGLAGMMRVFEIMVDPNDIHTSPEAEEFMKQLNQNYGWIGADFLQRCLPRAEIIGEDLLRIRTQFAADIRGHARERFMIAAAATALLGVALGIKLGYLPFDYTLMREWLIDEQIPAMREIAEREREKSAPETFINEYLEEIRPYICRFDKSPRPNAPSEMVYAPPNMGSLARYEIHKGEIWVRSTPFEEYCNKRRQDHNAILKPLIAKGLVTDRGRPRRMRIGDRNVEVQTRCFTIPIKASSPIAVPSQPPPDNSLNIVEFKKSKP